jgi:hypothetical protein
MYALYVRCYGVGIGVGFWIWGDFLASDFLGIESNIAGWIIQRDRNDKAQTTITCYL